MKSDHPPVLDEIHRLVRECKRCPLHKTRKKPVPGEGPANARMVIVGEAPGAQEDATGRPFVGAAGKLLDKALQHNGIRRDDVFITNVVKCRPPGNRVPRHDEAVACLPYLVGQLRAIKPVIVLALGATAANYLANLPTSLQHRPSYVPIKEFRGKVIKVKIGDIEFKLVSSYHPAAILRNRGLWNLLLDDIRLAKEIMGGEEDVALKTKEGHVTRAPYPYKA